VKQENPMTRYICDIQKRDHLTRQTWGNRYIFEAFSLGDARTAGLSAVLFEQQIHFDRVDFVSMRTSTQDPDDGLFIVDALVGNGGQITSGKTLPIFCTLDLNLVAAGGGRHGLKFYHVLVDDVFYDADGTFDDTYLGTVSTEVASLFSTLGDLDVSLVSPTGSHTYTSGVPLEEVKSHQFTKASKRTL
jgi:hypothetical protein